MSEIREDIRHGSTKQSEPNFTTKESEQTPNKNATGPYFATDPGSLNS